MTVTIEVFDKYGKGEVAQSRYVVRCASDGDEQVLWTNHLEEVLLFARHCLAGNAGG